MWSLYEGNKLNRRIQAPPFARFRCPYRLEILGTDSLKTVFGILVICALGDLLTLGSKSCSRDFSSVCLMHHPCEMGLNIWMNWALPIQNVKSDNLWKCFQEGHAFSRLLAQIIFDKRLRQPRNDSHCIYKTVQSFLAFDKGYCTLHCPHGLNKMKQARFECGSLLHATWASPQNACQNDHGTRQSRQQKQSSTSKQNTSQLLFLHNKKPHTNGWKIKGE